MKLEHQAMLATGIILAVGLTIVLIVFLPQEKQYVANISAHHANVLVTFDLTSPSKEWCSGMNDMLRHDNIQGIVFISGIDASNNTSCVLDIPSYVSVGSKTYDGVILPSIADYTEQLRQVHDGKQDIDQLVGVNTVVFKAPHNIVDQNIFSLLSNNNILLDFSYIDHYNKFYNGKFLRFDIKSYNGSSLSSSDITSIIGSNEPVMVYFDNSQSISTINNVLSNMTAGNVYFSSMKDITGVK
jgi:hypothetical protein